MRGISLLELPPALSHNLPLDGPRSHGPTVSVPVSPFPLVLYFSYFFFLFPPAPAHFPSLPSLFLFQRQLRPLFYIVFVFFSSVAFSPPFSALFFYIFFSLF